jgi:hypothetical protein
MTAPQMPAGTSKYRTLTSSTDSLSLTVSPTKSRPLAAAPHLHHSGYVTLANWYTRTLSTYYAVVTAAHLDLYASKHAHLNALTADVATVIATRTRIYMIGARVTDDGDDGRRFRVSTVTAQTYRFRVDSAAVKRSWLNVLSAVSRSGTPPPSVLNRNECGVCRSRIGFFNATARECGLCCRMTCRDCLPTPALSLCQKCAADAPRTAAGADTDSASGDGQQHNHDSHSHSHSVTHKHVPADDTTANTSPSVSPHRLGRTAVHDTTNTNVASPTSDTRLIAPPSAPPLPLVFRSLTVNVPPSPRGSIPVLSDDDAKLAVDKDTRLRAPPSANQSAPRILKPQKKLSTRQSAYKFPITHSDPQHKAAAADPWWMWCACA